MKMDKKYKNIQEDITFEFYYKKAEYISKITNCVVPINIAKVIKNYGGSSQTIVTSSAGVDYNLDELSNFSI